MSEPVPEGFPLDPAAMQRILDEMAAAGDAPDFMTTAIEAVAAMHARWYHGWIKAGIPEQRAAELLAIMVSTLFRAA